MRWLFPNFKLKLYPDRFREIEKVVRNLIKEVNDKHPFWNEENRLQVKEIFIYIDDQDIEANVDWKFNFKLILMTIGLPNLVKEEYWKNIDDLDTLSKEILNIEGLRALLFHEFSHPLDRANPKFLYRESPTLSSPQAFFVMSLWNSHIDGRLTKAGIPSISDLPSRVNEMLHVCVSKKIECDKTKLAEAIMAAWNADFMTYREIINTARDTIPFAMGDDPGF
jgi:hypothetical protein